MLERRKQSKNQTAPKEATEKVRDLVFGEESASFLHDVTYSNPGQEAPQEHFQLCWEADRMGRGWLRSAHGSLTRFPITLWVCPILFHLAMATQRLGCSGKPEG